MKKTLLNPVFLCCVILAIINQTLEKGFGVFIPLVHSYLDDLLCLPIVLTLGLSVYRIVWPNYKLRLWHMIPVLVVYSIYFEWHLPQFSSGYTSDIFDVLAYTVGLTLFSYFINDEIGLGLESQPKH